MSFLKSHLHHHLSGYSLMELTVVVGLVSILGVGISSAVLMSIITTSRTRGLSHIRATGEYSMSQMKQLIRNSKLITTCDSVNESLTLLNQDGGSTSLGTETVDDVTYIASNSGNFLTPADINIEALDITCSPSDTDPQLIQVQFDATLARDTLRKVEKPTIHFETSIQVRND